MPIATPDEVAEDLDAYVIDAPPTVREDRGDVVLVDGPGPSPLGRFASRVRFADDADGAIAAVRDWFRSRGRTAFTWKLGANTTPRDLESRLRADGAHEDEAEPDHTAMVLDRAPPGVDGIDVRRVDSYDMYVQSAEIMFVGFGGSFTAEEVEAMRAALPQRYEEYSAQDARRRYLALLNGVPVAMAAGIRTSAGVMALGGGATMPDARGHGAYRALVHARWMDAVGSGCTALVTQASGMSRPILERLGFRAVGPVLELIDTRAGDG